MLRGFDPYTELYHWFRMVMFFYVIMLLIVALIFICGWYSEGDSLAIWAIMLLGLIFPLGISMIYFLGVRGAKELDSLHKRRLEVLAGQNWERAMLQPAAFSMSLPCQTLRQVKSKRIIILSVSLAFLAIGAAALQWFLLNPSFYLNNIPRMLLDGLPMLQTPLLICLIIPLYATMSLIRGYYMLPSLDIDDHGISAHYGRHTVTIAWRNIRYFAMTNGKVLDRSTGEVDRYVYEICDGENVINWVPNARDTAGYQPLMANGDYTQLAARQLPEMIIARTGLPLLDLRLFKKPSRKIYLSSTVVGGSR